MLVDKLSSVTFRNCGVAQLLSGLNILVKLCLDLLCERLEVVGVYAALAVLQEVLQLREDAAVSLHDVEQQCERLARLAGVLPAVCQCSNGMEDADLRLDLSDNLADIRLTDVDVHRAGDDIVLHLLLGLRLRHTIRDLDRHSARLGLLIRVDASEPGVREEHIPRHAQLGVLLEQAHEEVLAWHREGSLDLVGHTNLLSVHQVEEFEVRLAVERRLAAEHLVEDSTHAPQVRTGSVRLSLQNLRCHIQR
mmetsp:Transcript_16607/g.64859  ORF Transcript_16607/g.64859 Transcript_16607/m.64859 type:complete len:250 (-) Transcript_16607:707-1456(-)